MCALRIDPWAAEKYDNYEEIMEKFGIGRFSAELPSMPKLMRRGIIFGQRDFGRIENAIKKRKKFAVLTGLSPSGKMHLGHKMVIDQVIYYQKCGGDIFIAVADIEAYAIRGLSLEKSKTLAIEEYILNYIALGLEPKNCQIYFQSKRNAVKDLAYLMADKVNLSEMMAIYGFGGETSMAHVFVPLVQVGDILHVQLERYGGPRPTIVPVGIDQDPHLRLTRDLASAHRIYSVIPRGDSVGIFVKKNDKVEHYIRLAKDALSGEYSEFKANLPYKALYVLDASPNDADKIDSLLIECERGENSLLFYRPSSTYHRLMTGLTGGKMSSSEPRSAIFLSDPAGQATAKIMNALTGGAVSAKEQRRLGGRPEVCSVYELFLYHLVDDDKYLGEIYDSCKNGNRLCGPCKKEAADMLAEFLSALAEKRKCARDELSNYVTYS